MHRRILKRKKGPVSRRYTLEPLVDYSHSLLLTSNDYVDAMQRKADRRDIVRREAEWHCREAQERRLLKEGEKARKETAKVQCKAEKVALAAFKADGGKVQLEP